MLRTRFTELFGLEHPVMSAPMALHSGGNLAGAVSAAGGLGSFGGVHPTADAEWMQGQIEIVRARTTHPFAVGFISDFIPMVRPLFDAALEGRPDAVALSFGDPGPWTAACKAAGARVICQVQTLEAADRAVDAGTDLLVAQGTEAGGHTGTMSLLPLLAGVAARHTGVPLLAAGGIGDGRTLAAALTAGADGAWLGTAFLATPEAVEVAEAHKRLIVESDGNDTVLTRAYDILTGFPWPRGIGERVRRNRFTDEWSAREAELLDRREEVAATRAAAAEARATGSSGEDLATAEVLYGQSAGFVRAVRPAAEVVRSVSEDAEYWLRTRPGALVSR